MPPERDLPTPPQPAPYPAAPSAMAGSRPDESASASLFQEINARRARIEKPELLRHLRGL